MLGITFANFSELNFSLLTPFILGEYGFSKIQVATVMSILAGIDVATRLTIPFVADFIGWQNRTFFLVGICAMALGRIGKKLMDLFLLQLINQLLNSKVCIRVYKTQDISKISIINCKITL